jgi:hypothetical protein
MSSTEKTAFPRVALAAAVMIVAVLFTAAMITEWWPIIVTRNAAHIASYHFGSESMMGHGGWRYSNPNVYAWTAFAEASAGTATLPALWMVIVRRSRKAAFALVFICAAYACLAVVLGLIHWTTRESLAQSAAEQAVAALVPERQGVNPTVLHA